MNREGITGLSGGHTYTAGRLSIDNNPSHLYPESTFQRIDIAMIQGGDVNITAVKFMNESGIHHLPSEYFQFISGKTLIIKPNAPAHIVIQTSGSGEYAINTRTEPSAYTLAPKAEMSMTVQTLQVRLPQGEGWVDYPTTYSTKNERGIEGTNLNMLFGVVNDGLTGGDIIARVRVGDGSAFALMGRSGRVFGRTGVHLHYEVMSSDGQLLDPATLAPLEQG